MFSDWFSSASELNKEFTGSKSVGLCGVGGKTCFDVVTPDANQLFVELQPTHPDYNEGLARLAKEMNIEFRKRAEKLLGSFSKANPDVRGTLHMAAIGSQEGLYLAYATKVPTDELFKRGATLAKSKLQKFADSLFTPPATGTGSTRKGSTK